MKDLEIFYFDIDGTILDNKTQQISEVTIHALKRLKGLGYKLAICTGRTLGGILEIGIKDLVEWDLFILANGSLILDKDLNVLEATNCEPDFIQDLSKEYPEGMILEGDHLFISDVLSDHMVDFLRSGKLEIPPIYNQEDVLFQKVILEDLTLVEDGFNNPLFSDYQYNINTHKLYEIFPKKAGKHVGIEIANAYFKVSRSGFFGDGTNDITALQYATVGIAMGNASNEVKDASDITTDAIDEEGIYNILNDRVFKHYQ